MRGIHELRGVAAVDCFQPARLDRAARTARAVGAGRECCQHDIGRVGFDVDGVRFVDDSREARALDDGEVPVLGEREVHAAAHGRTGRGDEAHGTQRETVCVPPPGRTAQASVGHMTDRLDVARHEGDVSHQHDGVVRARSVAHRIDQGVDSGVELVGSAFRTVEDLEGVLRRLPLDLFECEVRSEFVAEQQRQAQCGQNGEELQQGHWPVSHGHFGVLFGRD